MLGGLWPVAHIDPRLWDKIVSTNLGSAYRLIRSMEPLLRRAEAGRALFLTSGRAVRPKAFWGSYAATKAGLEALVRCWADEIEHTQVRAVLIDPNVMRTRMRAEAFPGEDPDTLPHPSEIGPMIVGLAAASELGLPASTVLFSEWKAAQPVPSTRGSLPST
jgi:NAD(P)-dependent dehydrogenase (short-subunit alcohol dehydrogenase family)